MTNNRVSFSRSYRPSVEWAGIERREPSKGLVVLCLMGAPAVALFITFRMFRDKKPVA